MQMFSSADKGAVNSEPNERRHDLLVRKLCAPKLPKDQRNFSLAKDRFLRTIGERTGPFVRNPSMEPDLQHESLSEEIKVRLTSSQLRSLEEVARNSASKPSSYARFILHEFLMGNDAEYNVSHKERKPYGHSSNKESFSAKATVRKSPTKAKRGHLRDIQEVSLPIFGTIPAGWPTDNQAAKSKRTIKVPKGKYSRTAFGLDVRGNSMNAAVGKPGPIRNGDVVVLEPFETAEKAQGKIVAALSDGQTTLKRLTVLPDGRLELTSETKDPLAARRFVAEYDLVIQGVVVDRLLHANL